MERTFVQFIKKPFHSAMVLGPHHETLPYRALSNKHTTIRHITGVMQYPQWAERLCPDLSEGGLPTSRLSTSINAMCQGLEHTQRQSLPLKEATV